MEKFRILLTPAEEEGLDTIMDINAKDIDAAKSQATAYLLMLGGKCKCATIFSEWKSSTSWRQAIDPIVYNFNL